MMIAMTLLLLATTPTKPEAPEGASGNLKQIVCKRFLETGSLVKGYRECKTRWEWQRERDNKRDIMRSGASCLPDRCA